MFVRHPYDNDFRSSNEDFDFVPFTFDREDRERQMMPPPTGRPPMAPTGTPPTAPTGRPPMTPTGTPQMAPTGRPPMTPTGRPPMTPTGTPQMAPTGRPPMTPTGTPQMAPTGRPPMTPTGRPPMTPTGTPQMAPTGRPPMAPTGRPPMAPTGRPPMGPPGVGGQFGAPSSPPPNFTPQKAAGVQPFAVSQASIRPCRFQFVYIWPTTGRPFWAWLINVDRRSIAGFRWNGRRWVYFGMDLRRIAMFECFGRSFLREAMDLSSNIRNVSIAPSSFKTDYPIIEGLQNENVQSNINGSIIEKLNSMFNSAVFLPEQTNFNEIVSSYILSLQRNGLISILFYLYTNTMGGNENTVYSSLVIDANTGQEYDLEDLFNPSSNFRERLSQLAVQRAMAENIPFTENFEGNIENQQFYLTPDALVLFYQPGEYTPASYGLFEIAIPYSDIRDLFSQTNPISRMTT